MFLLIVVNFFRVRDNHTMDNLGVEADSSDSGGEGLELPDFDSLCLNPYR